MTDDPYKIRVTQDKADPTLVHISCEVPASLLVGTLPLSGDLAGPYPHPEALNVEHLRAALAEARERIARLEGFIGDLADYDCEYGDNCPTNTGSRHGTCIPCKARKALQG